MFERYSEEARRSLFFSRYEATQRGHMAIEPVDLLLGLARERMGGVFGPDGIARLNERLASSRSPQRVSTSVEIPFDGATRRALEEAARIADEHTHHWIGPEHLLAGVVGVADVPLTTLLEEFGLTRERAMELVVAANGAAAQGGAGHVQGSVGGLKHFGPMFIEARLRSQADELFIATDAKDWDRARALFADGLIEVDMSSLVGGGPVTATADELIAGFRVALHQGKTSHHMATNHRVTLRPDGQTAEVFCHGYAWNRVALFAPGDDLWETWGTYELSFSLTSGDWRITRFKYVSKLARGNDAVRAHV